MDVLVIGAGVCGLTTGISLAEAGLSVTIRTAAPPERTTSVAAGAVWGAVRVGPPERVLGWARTGLEVLSKLAAEPGTGVRIGSGDFYVTRDEEPPWIVSMFPHGETVLLGGTNEEGSWDLEPKPFIAERIVAHCAAIDPRLRGATILGHRVGLRPYRSEVRLESEPFGGGVLWHNYGHGGAGGSPGWGGAGGAVPAVRFPGGPPPPAPPPRARSPP